MRLMLRRTPTAMVTRDAEELVRVRRLMMRLRETVLGEVLLRMRLMLTGLAVNCLPLLLLFETEMKTDSGVNHVLLRPIDAVEGASAVTGVIGREPIGTGACRPAMRRMGDESSDRIVPKPSPAEPATADLVRVRDRGDIRQGLHPANQLLLGVPSTDTASVMLGEQIVQRQRPAGESLLRGGVGGIVHFLQGTILL